MAMSYKKYKKDRRPYEIYYATLWEEGTNAMGSKIIIDYSGEKFIIVKVFWGNEVDYEYSSDGEVEMNWCFDEENTRKLMLRMGVRTGKDLIEVMKARFMPKEEASVSSILDFCDEKGIEYSYYVHY